MVAVIFDQDGTLVDLFDQHLMGFQRILGDEFDLDFKRSDLAEHYGKTGEEILRIFLEGHGISDADIEGMAVRRREWVGRNIGYCKVLPGVKRLLQEMEEDGIPMAVGTSNTKDLAEAILRSCDLDRYFRYVASRGPDTRGKPAPDIFLKAAEGLCAAPADCIVVEDSIFGIVAAKAAGMKSVAVATGEHTVDELRIHDPDLLVESLEDVRADDILRLSGGINSSLD